MAKGDRALASVLAGAARKQHVLRCISATTYTRAVRSARARAAEASSLAP